MYTSSKSTDGLCHVQMHAISNSKDADKAPGAPVLFEELDDETIINLRSFDAILIDTCELMSTALEFFLKLNAAAFRASGIKFLVTPQVIMELYRNMHHQAEAKSLSASRAWALIASAEYRDLFDTYPPSSIDTHADANLIDAARTLKLRHEKSVLVLTSDKQLTSSIFNTCWVDSCGDGHGHVQVLYIDTQNAKLTRYHESRLESLANGISLPEWNLIGAPKARPWYERYFHESIHNGVVFIDSCALRHVLGIGTGKTDFTTNLQALAALRPGQKINVVTTSLCDPDIQERVTAMPNLFNVIKPIAPNMREDEAIFQAMLDAARCLHENHLLLIANWKGRIEYIQNRIPTAHKMPAFWGCFIDKRGFLRRSDDNSNASCLAA